VQFEPPPEPVGGVAQLELLNMEGRYAGDQAGIHRMHDPHAQPRAVAGPQVAEQPGLDLVQSPGPGAIGPGRAGHGAAAAGGVDPGLADLPGAGAGAHQRAHGRALFEPKAQRQHRAGLLRHEAGDLLHRVAVGHQHDAVDLVALAQQGARIDQ
jgi:hypothetical protein